MISKHSIRAALAPLFGAALVISLAWSERAQSIPRFSAEQGLPCVECHFAPGGGAQRNEFGHFTMSVNELTLQSTKAKLIDSYKSPRLSDAVIVGSDVRFRLDDRGESQRYQTDFYLSLEPLRKVFFNLTFSGGTIDESYLLVTNGDNSLFAQAGRYYPGYGLRLEDFTSFVKNRTGVFHRTALEGATIGAQRGGYLVSVSYYTSLSQKMVVGNISGATTLGTVSYFYGISARASEELDAGGYGRFPPLKGAYAGVGWRGHSLSFEGDLIGKGNDAYAIYWGASLRVIPGLYGKLDYNFHDPDRRVTSGAEEFVRASVELWPIPFVEVNPGVTFYTDGPAKDTEEFDLRLHLAY
ncbi:MAG TPA: hypothetical protein VLB27_09170 [candidate division Zixibacteria bacterium]|nr:hypothetical protein [candidate division Zixibacteria bacterium]